MLTDGFGTYIVGFGAAVVVCVFTVDDGVVVVGLEVVGFWFVVGVLGFVAGEVGVVGFGDGLGVGGAGVVQLGGVPTWPLGHDCA
ncbi:hypothetical protein JNM87_05755 [Candidatus Saccharibacteria bacterium]|nr:hypothetical protein [Candidatus Saccharibacteria bacterium]